MTDFLTRLVTATYGAAPLLRPRPVAPYEPMATPPPVWSAASEAPSVAPEEMTDRATPIASFAATPDLPTASRASAPSDGVAKTRRRAQPATREDHLAPADQGRSHDSLPARAAAAQDNLREAPAPHTRRAQQPTSFDVASPARSVAPLTPSQRLAVRPTSSNLPWSKVQSQPAPIHAEASSLRAVVTPAAGTSQPTGGNAPALPPLHPPTLAPAPAAALSTQRSAVVAAGVGEGEPAATRHSTPLAGRERSEQEQRAPVTRAEGDVTPAPIVRVTIGRILIQAAPAPPTRAVAARASQPATPALSLDQYLKGRNGGEA